MSADRDTGGQAFPGKRQYGSLAGNTPLFEYASGMSLRDYFAAEAIAPACAHVWANYAAAPRPIVSVAEIVAKLSYEMADAMLAERSKP
jgi:hypothetical protein